MMSFAPTLRFGLLLTAGLSGCAVDGRRPEGYQPSSVRLVLEGNEQAFPAFEAAAEACRYAAYWRFPGLKLDGIDYPPHYSLARVDTPGAGCALAWVKAHQELGLQLSSH